MTVKNIIVRMPNWIGDIVMATPILEDLRKNFPDVSITAMCRTPISDVLQKDPNIDELFCFTKPEGVMRRIHNRSITQKLERGKYDTGILLTNSLSSAWWFWQGKVKRRIGFRDHLRTFLLTDPVSFPANRKSQHLVRTYKELLKLLGIPISDTKPALYVNEQEIEDAYALLEPFGVTRKNRIVGMNPGAAYGSAKCWIPERFKEVALRLIENDPKVVVLCFGDHSTKKLVNEICQGLPSRIVNLAGATNLRQFMAMIKVCDAFLTNDSGPMHLADSLHTPTVALFGSTDPTVTGPYHQMNVIQKKVECGPCFKRECPLDFRCMKGISSQEVYQALLEALKP